MIEDILKKHRIFEDKNDVYHNEQITRVNRLFGLKDLLDFYNVDKNWIICEILGNSIGR